MRMDDEDDLNDDDLPVFRGLKNALIMTAVTAAAIFGSWFLAKIILG